MGRYLFDSKYVIRRFANSISNILDKINVIEIFRLLTLTQEALFGTRTTYAVLQYQGEGLLLISKQKIIDSLEFNSFKSNSLRNI